MSKTALVFGAGKTGRGFAAHLAYLGGYDIILIDKDRQLVDNLKKQGEYVVQILDKEEMSCTIKLTAAYHIEDSAWHAAFCETGLAFTAVFGSNLHKLARILAVPLHKRFMQNSEQELTLITCENMTDAAGFLKKRILENLPEDGACWLSERVGFSEAIVFRTCLDAAPDQPPLTIRTQNFFELPCDGEAVKGPLTVYGLKPLKNFGNQLKRKIFTYNCINAVITYLGAQKGYAFLHEAGNDESILATARRAASEIALALIAEFGFNEKEQEEWVQAALVKFRDKNIPDPIERNGADPLRKLGREERLIGPALLALKHQIEPRGLVEGIMACLAYTDPVTKIAVKDCIREKGVAIFLHEVCGLAQEEELFVIISEQIEKRGLHGN